MSRPTTPELFWSKIDKTGGKNSCWNWPNKACDGFGYGMQMWYGKCIRAHRLAWMLTYGTIPKGTKVCHHCDNPKCCNPDHLFLGNDAVNIMDAAKKNRLMQKLDFEQVNDIRERALHGETQTQIAAAYGINQSNVSRIKNRTRRQHVPIVI